jgi:hypothetical protein
MSGLAPFDPGDPFDAMSELFRTQVIQLLIDAEKITIYRELDPKRQLECFVAGALTGLVGGCLAQIKPEGYDYIMEYIGQCLPMARRFSESVKTPDGSAALSHNSTRKER